MSFAHCTVLNPGAGFARYDSGMVRVEQSKIRRRKLFRRIAPFLLTVAVLLCVLPSYLWPYAIAGASAAPTILMGDTFIVNRAAYDFRLPYLPVNLLHLRKPRRGDIVQASLPGVTGVSIKRVIGLPGETIEIRENRVLVNGEPLPVRGSDSTDFSWVPATHHMGSTVVLENGYAVAYTPGVSQYSNCSPVRLGPDEYFLMGDNRDNSIDSRSFGPIPRRNIVGNALLVLATGQRLHKPN